MSVVLEFMFGAKALSQIALRPTLQGWYNRFKERPAMKKYFAVALPVLYDGVKAEQ